jgi:hypothetical protein
LERVGTRPSRRLLHVPGPRCRSTKARSHHRRSRQRRQNPPGTIDSDNFYSRGMTGEPPSVRAAREGLARRRDADAGDDLAATHALLRELDRVRAARPRSLDRESPRSRGRFAESSRHGHASIGCQPGSWAGRPKQTMIASSSAIDQRGPYSGSWSTGCRSVDTASPDPRSVRAHTSVGTPAALVAAATSDLTLSREANQLAEAPTSRGPGSSVFRYG